MFSHLFIVSSHTPVSSTRSMCSLPSQFLDKIHELVPLNLLSVFLLCFENSRMNDLLQLTL